MFGDAETGVSDSENLPDTRNLDADVFSDVMSSPSTRK
jgi:hypothetical protein